MDRYHKLAEELGSHIKRQPFPIHKLKSLVVKEVKPMHKPNSAIKNSRISFSNPSTSIFKYP